MGRLLIVDDEPAICWGIREFLLDEGHEVRIASSAEEGLKYASAEKFDAVILDIRLPGMDGLSALGELRRRTRNAPIIVITAFGDLETAVRAISEGAFDYLPKPFDLEEAASIIRRALVSRSRQDEGAGSPTSQSVAEETLLGSSPAMQVVFKQIALVSQSEVPVLITGEGGTGKELVARAIHSHSSRRDCPFLPISIGALNPQTVEAELFGYCKGAFPGASTARQGLLEQARGGTLLLDEISEASPAIQIKMLRAIESREILPLGEVRPRPIDVRILASTRKPLVELLTAQNFREDLYFRLSGFHIHLPPLRERPEDIDLLTGRILDSRSSRDPALKLSREARQALHRRRWSGNVRELRHVLEHAILVGRQGELQPAHFPDEIRFEADETENREGEPIEQKILEWIERKLELHFREPSEELYERFLSIVEPPFLRSILENCDGNRALAAQRLGIHRATLRQKLRKYELG